MWLVFITFLSYTCFIIPIHAAQEEGALTLVHWLDSEFAHTPFSLSWCFISQNVLLQSLFGYLLAFLAKGQRYLKRLRKSLPHLDAANPRSVLPGVEEHLTTLIPMSTCSQVNEVPPNSPTIFHQIIQSAMACKVVRLSMPPRDSWLRIVATTTSLFMSVYTSWTSTPGQYLCIDSSKKRRRSSVRRSSIQ